MIGMTATIADVLRISEKIQFTPTCWLWTASVDKDGYGRAYCKGRGYRAHRLVYELLVGPIPDDHQIDHVRANGCTNKNCVRPEHLEPVTGRENLMRGDTIPARNAAKTHCPRGHPYSGPNLMVSKGVRFCRTCMAAHKKRVYAANR